MGWGRMLLLGKLIDEIDAQDGTAAGRLMVAV